MYLHNLGVGFDEVVTMIDSFGSSHDDFIAASSNQFFSSACKPWKSENDLDLMDAFLEDVDSLDFDVFDTSKKRSRT